MADTRVATGAERIAAAFARSEERAALMPYIMGGFPDLAGSLALGRALAGAGADLIEVGVPFSDPLADGPAIQAAGQQALAGGATFERILSEVVGPLSERLPVVVMCYSNPILRRGFGPVAAALSAHGACGLIAPDLPAAEAAELRAACDAEGVALVPLVAPTTGHEEARAIAAAARGFVYTVSVTGVTGERTDLPPELGEVVRRVREHASVPVAVGFGVGTPEQAAQVGAVADGVIIGSRLVRAVAEAPGPAEGIAAAERFMRATSAALSAG